MFWLRSLLFYKTFSLFSFFITFVLSCPPELNNGDVFSISQSNEPYNRFQIQEGDAKPNVAIFSVRPINNQPLYYEIFLLTQPVLGSYEFRPFQDFYRTLVIEMNAATPFPIVLNYNTGFDNQRFSIECAECRNSQSNSTEWTKYHTSCLITNKASNLCITSLGDNNNLGQSGCGSAVKWDLFGRVSTDSTGSSSPILKTDPNNVQISKGGLAATVLGSIIGTSLIALAISYWFIKRKRIYPVHALNT